MRDRKLEAARSRIAGERGAPVPTDWPPRWVARRPSRTGKKMLPRHVQPYDRAAPGRKDAALSWDGE